MQANNLLGEEGIKEGSHCLASMLSIGIFLGKIPIEEQVNAGLDLALRSLSNEYELSGEELAEVGGSGGKLFHN